MTLRQRRPRIKNEAHLALIRQLPCVVCFRHPPSEAAHIRYGDCQHDKPPTGGAEKPDDKWTLPLCPEHHRTGRDAQHRMNEREWWLKHGIDPLALSKKLSLCETLEDMESVISTILYGRSDLW